MGRYGQADNKAWSVPADDTRYARASEVWDERIGAPRAQSANWRLIAFVAMGVAALAVAGLIYQSSKAQVVPYLIEVEAEGQVRLVGQVRTQHWSLPESAKKRELEQWIRNLRSLSSDAQVLKERFASVRLHATQAANMQLDAMLERDDPFKRFGSEMRTVQIKATTTLPGSTHAYRVEWDEQIFDESGREGAIEPFVGEFHLQIDPPTTAAALEANPLGVYVSFVDISKKR